MQYHVGKTVVVGFGGSVLAPDHYIDITLLKKFVRLIIRYSLRRKFIIVVGGGSLSRSYQNAARKVLHITKTEQDWIGIYATRLHAELLRAVFGTYADSRVIDNAEKTYPLARPVTIVSGWAPGNSTDCIVAVCAARYGVQEFILAGKPAYIYTKNPDIYRNAKPIHTLTWNEYRAMSPREWNPGDHMPVDPVAAEFAEKHYLTGIVVNGKNLVNFQNLLQGRSFKGSIVR